LGINEGPFQCAVYIPGAVAENDVEATYDDGLLTITLPKRVPVSRRIPVTGEVRPLDITTGSAEDATDGRDGKSDEA
jgi:hypothetical protein